MSAIAMSMGFSLLPATGGSMCNSTLLRRHRQPFMFLTARLAPVCMCRFMTGSDTRKSHSTASGQTRESLQRPALGQRNLHVTAPVHVQQRTVARGGDGRDAGSRERLVHADPDDRALADRHLRAGLAKRVDRRGDDLRVRHDPRPGRGDAAGVRLEQHAFPAGRRQVHGRQRARVLAYAPPPCATYTEDKDDSGGCLPNMSANCWKGAGVSRA